MSFPDLKPNLTQSAVDDFPSVRGTFLYSEARRCTKLTVRHGTGSLIAAIQLGSLATSWASRLGEFRFYAACRTTLTVLGGRLEMPTISTWRSVLRTGFP